MGSESEFWPPFFRCRRCWTEWTCDIGIWRAHSALVTGGTTVHVDSTHGRHLLCPLNCLFYVQNPWPGKADRTTAASRIWTPRNTQSVKFGRHVMTARTDACFEHDSRAGSLVRVEWNLIKERAYGKGHWALRRQWIRQTGITCNIIFVLYCACTYCLLHSVRYNQLQSKNIVCSHILCVTTLICISGTAFCSSFFFFFCIYNGIMHVSRITNLH